ncbi:MAG TPA: VOC family protein [Hanamia sp.]|nr:VOC family protein [Hanamia sp.]
MKIRIVIIGLVSFLLTINQASAQYRSTTTKAALNHIALYVHDLKTSTDFYKNIIGLDTIPEPFHDGKHTWFQISKHANLHIISGNVKEQTHIKDTHLCFSVPSVDAFIPRLEKAGVAYESWQGQAKKATIRVDGVKQIYFQDPDGYWIEVNDDRF